MKLAAPDREGGTGHYRFGDIVVDAPAHTLVRAGALQQIEPKTFAVLLALLRRPGELLERDELLDLVWGHRHVTPGVLTRAIAQLRHALDDDSHHPRYIQTQHAMGYRFIGVLETGDDPADVAAEPATGREARPLPASPAPGPAQARDLEQEAQPAQVLEHEPVGALDAMPEERTLAAAPGDESAPAAGPSPSASPRRRRRTRAWLAMAVVLVLALAAAWWLQGRAPAIPRPAEASIAVLPFTTLSNNHGDRYFAEGLAVEMHAALAGVPGIKVAARAAPGAIAGDEAPDVRALGRKLGVATVLDASIRREGKRVRVNARLSDTHTGYTLWTHSYDRELSDVFDVQSEIADEVVRALLGVIPGQSGTLARRLAPTRNIAAYDAYLKGLDRLQARGEADHLASAVGYFNQALSADSGFARAQAGICRAEIGNFESAREADAYARALEACQRAAQMDPGLHELSLAFGDLYRVRGESAKAIEQYTRALEDPAFAADANIGIANVHGANGRTELALEYLHRALSLRPGDGETWRGIGYLQYADGNIDGAIEAYRKATQLQPREVKAWSGLGGMYLAAGRKDEAVEAFRHALLIAPSYGVLSNLGTIQYEAGHYAEAARMYRQAADLRPEDYRGWGNLGDALVAQGGNDDEARAMYRRAVELAQPYVDIKSDDAQALASSAWYLANLGQADAARELLMRAEALGTERGEVSLWAAQALARLGDIDQARRRLDTAREEGVDPGRIRASPILRGLADPPLAAGRAEARRH